MVRKRERAGGEKERWRGYREIDRERGREEGGKAKNARSFIFSSPCFIQIVRNNPRHAFCAETKAFITWACHYMGKRHTFQVRRHTYSIYIKWFGSKYNLLQINIKMLVGSLLPCVIWNGHMHTTGKMRYEVKDRHQIDVAREKCAIKYIFVYT